ncbi:MAG TPA: lipid-A-disaccharide synthase [Proteobacteria bacterium]|nr:lipid-A-disaccharide synthase [Pseudomonadota bacterium]
MTADNTNIMILAGEPSGDIHGGHLCRELKKLDPGLQLFGMGGPEMENAGFEVVHRIGDTGVVGLWEVYKEIGKYWKIFKKMVAVMEERRPDAVILIDYPGFNIRFARKAHQLGIKVYYYISPQLWAWGQWRIKKIRRYVDMMLVIFPFEKEFYNSHGIEAEFVGHPLIGTLNPNLKKEDCRKQLGITSSPVIGLLPGSRKGEIEKILPLLLETAGILRDHLPEAEFLLPIASAELRPVVDDLMKSAPVEIKVVEENSQNIIVSSDLLILASGTVTLEAAVFLRPMIIVYKISFFSWIMGKLLIKIPFIGLVNIVSGKKIVQEFIQYQARPEAVARAGLEILTQPGIRDRMIRELKGVKEKLGLPGAAARAASVITNSL